MTRVRAAVVSVPDLSLADRAQMLALMQQFYEGVRPETFHADLDAKGTAILILDDSDQIVGFSTLRLVTVDVDGQPVTGIFSGDTILHRAHWGAIEPIVASIRYFTTLAAERGQLWWFLISKGYKTYKLMPLFFSTFWPNRFAETPPAEQSIMDAYASTLFGQRYDPTSGIITPSGADHLRSGVADIGDTQLKDADVAWFTAANPGWAHGDELVCLADLSPQNLRPAARRMLAR